MEAELKKLRDAREEAKFSRWEVARELDMTPQKLQRIEEGQKQDIGSDFPSRYRQVLLKLDAERRSKLVAGVGRAA